MKKLKLNKKVIIDLNNSEMKNLMGGVEVPMLYTGDFSGCDGTGCACPAIPDPTQDCNATGILCTTPTFHANCDRTSQGPGCPPKLW